MLNLVALMSFVNRLQTPLVFVGVTAMTFSACVMLFDSSDAKADAIDLTAAATAKAHPCAGLTGIEGWQCLDRVELQRLGY